MCGIFGILSTKRPIDVPFLEKAISCVSYRGPDTQGFFINKDRTVGLAHKRLSVIDLSQTGNQPMSDNGKNLWIVFNGEIYNFHELKEILLSDGYEFISTSDTEVLLYTYKKWGSECLKYINGMFAFAIYDSEENKFFLARDRVGKKPLFYTNYGGFFIFSSELKQIVSTGIIPINIDQNAINYYFALGYIPGNMCLIKHVKKLPPSHFLEFDLNSEIRINCYWDTPDFEMAKGEEQALEDIEELLTDSVKNRLISDVPLGVFLSGGIDSSLVVASMRKVHNGKIKTFSVGFEGSKKNELRYSRIVANYLGTTHNEIIVVPNFRDDLEHISGLLDEPIYDNSFLPTYYLSKYTKKYVTVGLSGDGGDEVFGGYIHYKSALIAKSIARLAIPPLNKIAGLIASRLPEGQFGKNTLYGISYRDKACFTFPTQIFKPGERKKLFKNNFFKSVDIESPTKYRENLMNKNYDFVNQMCYTDLKTMLVDDILVKVDRASMFNSLEVRCPFLDYRIIEYSFRHLPGSLKIKKGIKKYLLKKIAKKILPEDLKIERKQGFDIPADLLSRTYITKRILDFPSNEFISRTFVSQLINAQWSSRSHLWHKLFALYFFLRWLETWRK